MPVLNRIAGFAEEMIGWRQHLHRRPELALDCFDTAAFVVARLREMGVTDIHAGIANSGVVAVIEGQGPGPVTGLRADMDALPMEEETGVPHASEIPGRMHACGHDGHTTMLLGAAKYLAETRRFTGRVVLIFQPAEEIIGGGRIMVEEGVMDRFGIEEVYALHTEPGAPLGQFRSNEGAIMAAVDDWTVTYRGIGGHAAMPHKARSPFPAALGFATGLGAVTQGLDPLDPAVVSLTQIHGGTAFNVIPGEVWLTGTARSLSTVMRATLEARITALAHAQAEAFGLEVVLDYAKSYPPTVNHAAQARFAANVARQVSADVIDDLPPEMGAEDFAYMLEARPGAYLFLGQGIGPGLHHPEFDFNDAAAPYGASFFAALVEARHRLA